MRNWKFCPQCAAGLEYLFLRRAREPELGKWDAVGGFLAPGETAEECLVRESVEEIGCRPIGLSFLGTFTSTYGDTGLTTIGVAFLCALPDDARLRLSDENDECGWFPGNGMPELAFSDVRQAAGAALAAG